MEKVLVILGTAREDSNTLKAIGEHLPFKEYKLIELSKLNIQPYSYDGYKIEDDFLQIAELMIQSEVIVFATPVYWYAMSGIMKIFFDRLSDLISVQKPLGRALAGKKTWLFSTGSDDVLPQGFEVPFQKTSEYFDMVFQKSLYVSVKS